MTNLYEQLSERFSETAERQLSKGGTSLTYIPQAEVVARLNKVFGVQGWSMQILNLMREKSDHSDSDWIVAHVRLTATVVSDDGNKTFTFSRDGVGGQKIKRMKSGDAVDVGDEYKGAVSDALKKAASLLGVGLYLARDEDTLEEEHLANQPQPHPQWDQFMGLAKMLTADGKNALQAFWVERSGSTAKPTSTTVSDADMEALLEKAGELALNGEFVNT